MHSPKFWPRFLVALLLALILFLGSGAASLSSSSCGPFTDVGTLICPFVLELYYSGITAGTTSTTFSPNDPVTRGQMAIFTSTALDLSLALGGRRSALGQWWIPAPHYDAGLGVIVVGQHPLSLKSDGTDVWVPNDIDGTVSRVRASDGSVLGTWTGMQSPSAILAAMGKIFVSSPATPGNLYMIDPAQPPGVATTINTGCTSFDIAFDGENIWTTFYFGASFVCKITPVAPNSWSVSTFSIGFAGPDGALFDGNNIWVGNIEDNSLKKVNSDGSVALSVSVGTLPGLPVFDGRNIWMPNMLDNSLTVVRAADGVVLKTFSASNGDQNGLNGPLQAAFDGERIVVTNHNNGGLSLFKAADLSAIGVVPTPGMSAPSYVACDGNSFWISDNTTNVIARF